MLRLSVLIERAVNALAVIGLSILLFYAGAVVLDALLRSFANAPIALVREIADLVIAISAASCLPLVMYRRHNITLRVLEGILPAPIVRRVDVFAHCIVFVVLLTMAWQFFMFSAKTARAGDVTWLMQIPKAPFWYVASSIIAFAALVQGWVVLHPANSVPEDAEV
ncbi:hypothetical protein ACO34A_24595 (plasmid) [Rhizobium sp. ACO-34A]|nr:TRAP transporter small permease subunit [Rhizobium sp. ACO-34A]ATN36955.1 hypothetical protein ACO34A_24595 [Rhizobium sp. ACO-34A]